MRLAIIGFGLIGGSVARALAARDAGRWHVTAWSRSNAGPGAALADGVIDAVAPSATAALAGSELVLLAASPLANLELVARVGPMVALDGATLSDVTSAQVAIGRAAAAVPGLHHVGGHPMAGLEASGYDAARADLFAGRPWIVVAGESSRPEDVERVRTLALACGARPVELGAEDHDRLVAAVSHLPMLVAAALAEVVTASDDWSRAADLSAGGWRDSTRLARGDPELGAGIAALNRDRLLAWLDRYLEVLASWREMLSGIPDEPDPAAVKILEARFASVRAALGLWPGRG
ncbi:MAG: prephenate dehydrogenase [Candidatus Limnocylindrales bacterium]